MNNIKKHLEKFDFDIRKTGNARFMDQKVTPDILMIIADAILEFIKNNNDPFTITDIWKNDYINKNIVSIFGKPSVYDADAKNEYDKVFSQPIKMLAYSGILKENRNGRTNFYEVKNKEILEFISLKERNSLIFITQYLEKVLKDSKLWKHFKIFFDNNTKENFHSLKDNYVKYIIKYTDINKPTEPRRIFTKIINPLAHLRGSKGTIRGNLSKDIIEYNELMYNRKNWRDTKKMKNETRDQMEQRKSIEDKSRLREKAYFKYNMEKAKKLIKERYGLVSEMRDEWCVGDATNVHHIFSRSEFPSLEALVENLILLTATQHFTRAHPNNNTRRIDSDYQKLCLLTKSPAIENSEKNSDGFYSKKDFVKVLNTGMSPNELFNENDSFININKKIIYEYNSK